ncbi:MAG: GNAT family N-acetyltransferase, partial [Solirubrobacterales bacterium]
MEEVEFHDGLDPGLIAELMELFEGEWWTEGRERADVERMLTGSDMVISATERKGGTLVGVIRAITDGVYAATILDVIVAPDWRSQGLGVALMEHAHKHPVLAGCRRIGLICVEGMVPFYERFGYELAPPDHLRMIRRSP